MSQKEIDATVNRALELLPEFDKSEGSVTRALIEAIVTAIYEKDAAEAEKLPDVLRETLAEKVTSVGVIPHVSLKDLTPEEIKKTFSKEDAPMLEAISQVDIRQESIKTAIHLLKFIKDNTDEISPAMIQATAELIKTTNP